MYTVLNYIRPFEGNHKADVAPGENVWHPYSRESFKLLWIHLKWLYLQDFFPQMDRTQDEVVTAYLGLFL